MSDIYRPLFVIVEAVEAECRRLLEPPAPPPPRFDLWDAEQIFRRLYNDRTLHMERNPSDHGMTIGLRCKLCRKSHRLVIDEFELADTRDRIGLLRTKYDELYQMPCDLQLGRRKP